MKKYILIMLLLVGVLWTGVNCTYTQQKNVNEDNACSKMAEEGHVSEVDVLEHYIPKNINEFCNSQITRSASIAVPVTSPCDQKWRSKYPDNWMWQANRAITRADDELTSRYGIYFYSVSQKMWDSSGTTSDSLVNEAKSEWGLKDGAKLMIAFTGRKMSDGTMGQVSEIGKPYVIIINNGYSDNAETVQHEVGHCYGLKHRENDPNCVMTAIGMGHIGQICSTHNNTWNNNKNKY